MTATHTLFTRVQPLPALGPGGHEWCAQAVTTPDIVAMGAQLFCYVGAVAGGHERIIGLKLDAGALRVPVNLNQQPSTLAVDVGAPGSFDGAHVMDPAAAVTAGRVFLYYSGLGSGPDSIGLATSVDGITFVKSPDRILLGRAPEVVVRERQFFLFYVQEARLGGYAVHLATSADGIRFQEPSARPVLDGGSEGAWDSYSVTTPRVFARGGDYYMVYAGDDKTRDEPHAFGLARSTDLVHWTRYPHNPIFHRGPSGSWDDGAIWFGTVFEWNDALYLLYEGTSSAALRNATSASAVGVASCSTGEFDRCLADWRGA